MARETRQKAVGSRLQAPGSRSAALLLAAVALAVALAACGRTEFFPHLSKCVFDSDCPAGLRCVDQECRVLDIPDAGPWHGDKRFGEPCDAGLECASDYCVGGPRGAFCSRQCDGGDSCPGSYACKSLLYPPPAPPVDGGADGGELDGGAQVRTDLCAVPQPMLCQACRADLDCGASGGDLCLGLDGGSFCGRDCTWAGCPDLYRCQDFGGGVKQCVPEKRTCDCIPDTVGLQKGCAGERNQFGSCPGNQVCQADGGFTACAAPPALAETCNGVDDDCNGLIDDLPPTTCTKTLNGRTCTGPQLCLATGGLVCGARTPADEVCNYQDDDCNGVVDDGFVDGTGRYTGTKNCGVCNNDCARAIAHATTTLCDTAPAKPTCRATACEPGYFPYADGGLCLELPDTLCQACLQDSDCVGPGARCIVVDGASVCGRDCGPASPYPGCPAGYACSPLDGGVPQCTPSTGTCSCKTGTLGAMRSCTLDVCKGFATCAVSPQGPQWSACDVNTFNPEICDGKDNNCNGQVDEGFVNAATGRYDTAQNCGFCNNDCTRYWSPTLQHTTGFCDATPAMPTCAMGACLTETVGGTSYEWVNVNGDTGDGCECRRVLGNTTVDLPDRAPQPGGAPSWVDENCDGIDGVVTDAIFVSATAAAGGNGSRTAPLQTVTAGLAAMQSQGKRYVLVAQGLYRENVRLFDGAQLFGGYSSDFLKRDPRVHISYLEGVAPVSNAIAPIHAEGLGLGAVETVVAGFTLVGWDVGATPAGQDGLPSIGVYLRDCGPRVIISSNDVIGARGGNGGNGDTGAQGFGRQASGLLNGTQGLDSRFFSFGNCTPSNNQAGGAAGGNPSCPTANATAGGSVVCPQYVMGTHQGVEQQYVPPLVREGAGGFDWSFDTLSGGSCSHVTESGFPVNIQSHDGADGQQGADGPGGNGGAGAPAASRWGSVRNGLWAGAPAGAAAGLPGGTAQGGGGGAGGGVARFPMGGCQGWEIGATGGGGGAGGCGGTGGRWGGAGGASIGVFIIFSAPATPGPTLTGNRIQRGLGGVGGNGGFGGAGGLGGAAGFGGHSNRWSSSVGGKGGEGGNGGPGGGGGGGAGGPSYGILGYNLALMGYGATNTFLTPASVTTGGLGGAGGSSPGPASSTGTQGSTGASSDLLQLAPCVAGNCPLGSTCDANSVCIPN